MMENDLRKIIDELVCALRIPVEVDIWTSKEASAFLKCSPRQVLERYAPRPDFPPEIRLPTDSGVGHPRWYARDIIAWAGKYQVAA